MKWNSASMPIRLQKILSRVGVASRRHAETLILEGKVEVNGVVVRELGAKADPEKDKITVSGQEIGHLPQTLHYYAYYKPRGVLVTKRDDFGRNTVFAALDLPAAVNAVGRLDKESEGLLLLTDDGNFLLEYTHPRFQVTKVYHVQVSRTLTVGEMRRLQAGVRHEGKLLRAVSVKPLNHPMKGIIMDNYQNPWVEIAIQEGVKREIRIMLKAIGIKVLRLIRVRHGAVSLQGLQPGELQVLPKRPGFSDR